MRNAKDATYLANLPKMEGKLATCCKIDILEQKLPCRE